MADLFEGTGQGAGEAVGPRGLGASAALAIVSQRQGSEMPHALRGLGASAAPAMPRVDAILHHLIFQRELARVDALERDRAFCRHGLAHLLDVARVAWIRVLEDGLPLDRELVYAAALLHDIGRAEQYASGVPHDVTGERIAAEILGTVGDGTRFPSSDERAILDAVRGHRVRSEGARRGQLAEVVAWADKVSRPCFACPARTACNWPDGRKNLSLRI